MSDRNKAFLSDNEPPPEHIVTKPLNSTATRCCTTDYYWRTNILFDHAVFKTDLLFKYRGTMGTFCSTSVSLVSQSLKAVLPELSSQVNDNVTTTLRITTRLSVEPRWDDKYDKYSFKIRMYMNYCMFETLGQKPLQNSQLLKYSNPPSIISLRFEEKRGENMLDIISQPSLFLLFSIKIKRVVH